MLGEKNVETIIMGSALFNWGETHRMVSIGKELQDRGYRIVYLGSGKYDYLLENTGFIRQPVENDENWFTQERIEKMMDMDTYVNDYTTFEELDRQVCSEVEAMKKYNPVLIITGYRTTLSISARMLGVPLTWVMSSAISKDFFTKQIASLPENSILNRYFEKGKMEKNKEVMIAFVKKMMAIYDETSKVWNEVNKKYGLPKFECDLDIFKGELNIVSDPLEYGEENDGYRYCGPIFLRKSIEMPAVTEGIDQISKKKVFVILGSSGKTENFRNVLDSIKSLDYEFYIAHNNELSEKDIEHYPDNFHFAAKFPAYEMATKVDACITNGGQGTIYAVLAAGKPFVGIALFMEQQYNLETLTTRDCGILMQKGNINESTMKESLEKILYDERYINGAKAGEKVVKKYLFDQEYAAEKLSADIIEEYLYEKSSRECETVLL